jgi:hypothetical protein
MKKLLFLVAIFIMGCAGVSNMNKTESIKTYHVVYVDGILSRIQGESIRYIGKIAINTENATVKFDTLDPLNDAEKQCFYYTLERYQDRGLHYAESYDKKPKKKRRDDQVYQLWRGKFPDAPWTLITAVPYNKQEFWSVFEKNGFFCPKDSDTKPSSTYRYKIIDPDIGEIYYKNRWHTEQIKGELANAIFMGRGDCIYYQGESGKCP